MELIKIGELVLPKDTKLLYMHPHFVERPYDMRHYGVAAFDIPGTGCGVQCPLSKEDYDAVRGYFLPADLRMDKKSVEILPDFGIKKGDDAIAGRADNGGVIGNAVLKLSETDTDKPLLELLGGSASAALN